MRISARVVAIVHGAGRVGANVYGVGMDKGPWSRGKGAWHKHGQWSLE